MGAVGVVLGLFLAFSLALSYVSGDKDKKRLERSLALEERQRRILEREGTAANVDLEREREKIKAEVEARTKEEMKELEGKLNAPQEAKKRLQAEMVLSIEEEARKKAEAAWTQAEAFF